MAIISPRFSQNPLASHYHIPLSYPYTAVRRLPFALTILNHDAKISLINSY